MDDDLKQKCIDYINANAASLHGVEPKNLDIGPDVTVDNIVDASIRGDEAMVIVDRGVKGTPKYTIALSLLKEAKAAPAYTSLNPQLDPVEVEAKKVDVLKEKYQPGRGAGK
jgi:hypothetical protein